jgi:hypothetical protein
MKEFIYKMLEIHCTIYEKNFKEYKNLLDNKDTKNSLIFEFLNIYKN